jgi:hypothetical protein
MNHESSWPLHVDLQLVPSLNQMKPVYIVTSYFLKNSF